ncbi:MAG: hypothetical protein ABIH83_01185 [Candidatus Micrarchaeota archaeon]
MNSIIQNKKGFIFTVLALILISFIFISVQLWAQTQQIEEKRAAENFRIDAMRTSLSLIDNKSFSRFVNASMIYCLDNLSGTIEEHPQGEIMGIYRNAYSVEEENEPNRVRDPDGTYYVNKTMYELMVYGNTSAYITDSSNSYQNKFFYNYAIPEGMGIVWVQKNLTFSGEEKKYLLSYYFEETAKAAKMSGYNIEWGEVQDYNFSHRDEWTVGVYLKVPVKFYDDDGRVEINKLLEANVSVDINGFTDPSLLRNDLKYKLSPGGISIGTITDLYALPHKNVYHSQEYEVPADARAEIAAAAPDAIEGMGWFFGPVVSYGETKEYFEFVKNNPDLNYRFNISRINQYIYATTNVETAVEQSKYFGGIILLHQPAGFDDGFAINNIAPNCFLYQITQKGCLYKIRYYELRGRGCSVLADPDTYIKEPHYVVETIPKNTDIPYICLSGRLPDIEKNYHLGLSEALIENDVNYSEIMEEYNSATSKADRLAALRMKEASSTSADSKLWDMTGPRDMAICGYYVKSEYGPSYLQRLTVLKSYDGITPYSSPFLEYGIESFNVGAWAGGWRDPNANTADSRGVNNERRSRMDYHFYQEGVSTPKCSGVFEKGLPGCKSYWMCMEDKYIRQVGVGRFALTTLPDDANPGEVPSNRYNLEELEFTESLVNDGSSCR